MEHMRTHICTQITQTCLEDDPFARTCLRAEQLSARTFFVCWQNFAVRGRISVEKHSGFDVFHRTWKYTLNVVWKRRSLDFTILKGKLRFGNFARRLVDAISYAASCRQSAVVLRELEIKVEWFRGILLLSINAELKISGSFVLSD